MTLVLNALLTWDLVASVATLPKTETGFMVSSIRDKIGHNGKCTLEGKLHTNNSSSKHPSVSRDIDVSRDIAMVGTIHNIILVLTATPLRATYIRFATATLQISINGG